MRIVELINTLEIGGLERMVVDLAIQLRARGHDVSVICLRTAGPLKQVLDDAGVRALTLGKPEGFHLATLLTLVRYLKRQGAEAVHTHNVAVHAYGAVAARMARIPVVVNTRHGLGHYETAKSDRIFEWGCRLTDRVVAVSYAAREFFVSSSRVPAAKWAVVPNGIPVERFQATPRVRKSEIVFGIVGRLDAIKNHQNVIKAFDQIHTAHPHTRLRILGDGPLRKTLQDLTNRLDLGAVVQFEGASLDVSGFLAGLDVFVFGSRSEGLPLAILEAMASGLPIVSTAVGGIPEVVEEGVSGWLCPADAEPETLAALMGKAITADRQSMGERARERVVSSYSIGQMAAGYESLFGEIMGRRGAVRAELTHA